ncbi:MAG TPA: hypothetical protein VKB51_06250 [bacterium]|nr:hypothetical protein [bacterium]
MIDLKRIRAVALDVAGAGHSHDRQNDLSEFIWHLLERHYQMYIFSSNTDEDLAGEDFAHPQLVFLREEMPPTKALLEAHPQLLAPETVWITDDAQLQAWIRAAGLPFMYLEHHGHDLAGGHHLPHLSELSALLNPTALLLRDLTAMVDDVRRFRPQGALLVGIGGPPQSGYREFTLDLRALLQDAGHDLVELMDVSSLMRPMEALLEGDGDLADPWVSPEAGRWLCEAVLAPLRAGEPVFVEKRPANLPADFDAHFPLYLSEASVVLLFAELVFTQEVAEALDLSILLEVSSDETTRRLYEIPGGERFDPKFTEQYLKREGRIYNDYLQRNRVRERASIRVDANRPGAFQLGETDPAPLV